MSEVPRIAHRTQWRSRGMEDFALPEIVREWVSAPAQEAFLLDAVRSGPHWTSESRIFILVFARSLQGSR
jgi:hypothetical protein